MKAIRLNARGRLRGNQKMERHLQLTLALVVALSTVLIGSAAGPAGAAAPKSTFVWTPTSLALTVVQGSGTQADVSFVSSQKLANVTITAKGQISGLVTPSPATLSSVAAGTTVAIHLAVAVPVSTALGDYTGQIDVSPAQQKPGDDSKPEKHPAADTLPVTIHVVAPTVPPAPVHIYWTNASMGIGRADLDGSNPDPLFMPNSATGGETGLAVDAQHIYWTNANDGTIGRANLDGSSPNPNFIVLPADSQPIGIAVDAQHIYWAEFQFPAIGRANLDGTNVLPGFLPISVGGPYGVAVDAGHIYWAEQGGGWGASIARADLNGSNPDLTFIGVDALAAIGVAVDAQKIYWTAQTAQTSGAIGRANLDGSNQEPAIITGYPMFSVALDADHMFWSAQLPESIGRASLDGTNQEPSFINNGAHFVAVGG